MNCGDDEEADVWEPIADLDQVVGTWKGSYSENMKLSEFFARMGDDDFFDPDDMSGLDNLRVSISADITTVISEGYVQDTTVRTTMTFSGEGIDMMWMVFSGFFAMAGDAEVDDNAHSVTTTDTDSQDLTLTNIEGIRINQTAAKILIPAGMMDDMAPEITMYLQ
jgi:hypothetical protein